MTEKQKEFLNLCICEQKSFKEIAEKLGVSQPTISLWYEELKEERTAMAAVRNLWLRKKINKPFFDFYKWYLSQERKCYYCHITEQDINTLIEFKKLKTKRLVTRGRTLELDRKIPNPDYNDLKNLVLCCYWCNNAKTDTFSEQEFLRVGAVFAEVWREKLESIGHTESKIQIQDADETLFGEKEFIANIDKSLKQADARNTI